MSAERAGSRSRTVALAALPITALLAASLVFELQWSPHKLPVGQGLPCLVVTSATTVRLDGNVVPHLLADSDATHLRQRPRLWYVTPARNGVVAHPIRVAAGRAAVRAVPVRIAAARRGVYDVGTWSGPQPVLVALRQRQQSVVSTVMTLDERPRVVATGFTPDPRPGPSVHRDFFLARYDGTRPDLFVVDRDAHTGDVLLSIYSGESRFSKAIVDRRKVGVTYIDPPVWSVDVANVKGDGPDFVYFRTASGSFYGRPEAHIAPAANGYRLVTVHATIAPALGRGPGFVVASSLAGPAAYSLTRAGQGLELRAVPLGTPVSSPTCDQHLSSK